MTIAAKTAAWLPRLQAFVGEVALLLARLTIGQAFILTGWGKLANLQRTAGYFADLGLPLPPVAAAVIGACELAGGVLLVLGLFTRSAATVLALVLAGAIATAERAAFLAALAPAPQAGLTDVVPWMFALVLLPLIAWGAGRVSVDHFLCRGGAR